MALIEGSMFRLTIPYTTTGSVGDPVPESNEVIT